MDAKQLYAYMKFVQAVMINLLSALLGITGRQTNSCSVHLGPH